MNAGLYKAASINFIANFGTFGIALFIPNIATELGASGFQLSAIIVSYNLSLFLTSWYFGRVADIKGKKYVILFGLGISIIAGLFHVFINSITVLFAVRIFLGAALGIFPGALIAYAYESGKKLGIYAGFGAAGVAVGSLVVGMIGNYTQIFIACSVFMLSALALAHTLPSTCEIKHSVPLFPKMVIKRGWPAYSGVLIRHVGATAIWTIFPVFLAKIGCTPFQIGFLYTLNTGTQAVSMFALDKVASTKLLPIGFGLSAITFTSFTFATNFYQMIPTQILLGISWATMYVGALKYINERNEEHATASGLLSSTTSAANILGPVITGVVIGNIAVSSASIITFHMIMYFASLFALVALIIYLFGDRKNGNS
ncbi:MAG: MFS transporter [Thermoplasmata archaeon]